MRATNTTNVGLAVVMAEPCLPMTAVSRISFRINKLNWMLVGVCYRNVLQKSNFQWIGKICAHSGRNSTG